MSCDISVYELFYGYQWVWESGVFASTALGATVVSVKLPEQAIGSRRADSPEGYARPLVSGRATVAKMAAELAIGFTF